MFPPKKISRAWLGHCIDCTPEGRKVCQGRCCEWKKIEDGPRYQETELDKLPERLRSRLVFCDEAWHIPMRNGRCSFSDDCMEHQEYKPLGCWLFPFNINKSGTLIVQRWTTLHCPNWDKGPEMWIALEESLKHVFGDEFYDHLKDYMETEVEIKKTTGMRKLTDVF